MTDEQQAPDTTPREDAIHESAPPKATVAAVKRALAAGAPLPAGVTINFGAARQIRIGGD